MLAHTPNSPQEIDKDKETTDADRKLTAADVEEECPSTLQEPLEKTMNIIGQYIIENIPIET